MTEDCRSPATGSHELSLTRLIEAAPEQCFRAWMAAAWSGSLERLAALLGEAPAT